MRVLYTEESDIRIACDRITGTIYLKMTVSHCHKSVPLRIDSFQPRTLRSWALVAALPLFNWTTIITIVEVPKQNAAANQADAFYKPGRRAERHSGKTPNCSDSQRKGVRLRTGIAFGPSPDSPQTLGGRMEWCLDGAKA